MNLTTEDFITVAYQTGGKIVNHSINGVGTVIGDIKLHASHVLKYSPDGLKF